MFVLQPICAILFAILLSACAAGGLEPYEQKQDFGIIHEYVRSKFHWQPHQYRIEPARQPNDSTKSHAASAEFWVIFLADEADWKAGKFGGGKSFTVIVDVENKKIIKQLAFQ